MDCSLKNNIADISESNTIYRIDFKKLIVTHHYLKTVIKYLRVLHILCAICRFARFLVEIKLYMVLGTESLFNSC